MKGRKQQVGLDFTGVSAGCRDSGFNQNMQTTESGGRGGSVGEGRFGEYGARLHVSLTITFQ